MTAIRIKTPRWFVPLLAPARYKAAWGGRGSGKSHAFAEMVVERCVMAPTDVVCIREIQKSLAQSVKKLIELKIEAMGVGSLFEVQESRIFGKNGSQIIFIGMQTHTADSIKSLEGYDIAWVEEAQSLSQRSLDLLRPTIRKEGSEIWFSWNPNLESDPVDAFLRSSNPPPDAVVVQANYQDNPWLPDVLRTELEYDRKRDPDKFAHVWLGGYNKHSQAQIFAGKWVIEEFEPGDHWEGPYHGLDFGFAVDPTAAVKCWIHDRKIWIEHEAFRVGLELDDTAPFLSERIPGIARHVVRADSARPESISYLRRHGLPRCEPVLKGKGSVEDGIEFIKSFERVVIHPRCEEMAREARLYSYKVDRSSGDILPKIADEFNHGWDACIEHGQMVQTDTGPVPVQDVNAGALVATRSGYRRVTAARLTHASASIYELETVSGHRLRATADHLVFVNGKGFLTMDALRYDDEVVIYTEMPLCQISALKSSATAGSCGGDTRSRGIEPIESISSVRYQADRCSCTGRYGLTTTVQSLKAIIFTTLTATARTTIRRISAVFPRSVIAQSMNHGVGGLMRCGSTSTASGLLQRRGTPARKGGRSIAASALWRTLSSFLSRNSASIADEPSSLARPATATSSAPTHASLPTGASAGSMTLSEPVLSVARPLSPIASRPYGFAVDRVRCVRDTGTRNRVYDLSVEEAEEFFASGVLVHNCRYALEPMMKDRDYMARFLAMAS
jgi:phage terminase large subunit